MTEGEGEGGGAEGESGLVFVATGDERGWRSFPTGYQ